MLIAVIGHVVRALLVLGVGILAASWLAGMVADGLARRGFDPELRAVLVRAVDRGLAGAAVVVALAVLGLPMGPIVGLFALGVLVAAVIGRDALANVAAGAWLLQVRPFRAGDAIAIGEERGKVVNVGWLATTLVDEEGAKRVLPNAWVVARPVRVLPPAPAEK